MTNVKNYEREEILCELIWLIYRTGHFNQQDTSRVARGMADVVDKELENIKALKKQLQHKHNKGL